MSHSRVASPLNQSPSGHKATPDAMRKMSRTGARPRKKHENLPHTRRSSAPRTSRTAARGGAEKRRSEERSAAAGKKSERGRIARAGTSQREKARKCGTRQTVCISNLKAFDNGRFSRPLAVLLTRRPSAPGGKRPRRAGGTALLRVFVYDGLKTISNGTQWLLDHSGFSAGFPVSLPLSLSLRPSSQINYSTGERGARLFSVLRGNSRGDLPFKGEPSG